MVAEQLGAVSEVAQIRIDEVTRAASKFVSFSNTDCD